MTRIKTFTTAVLFLMLMAWPLRAEDLIPYESFTLDNGLRVVVHEDRKAPIVAVSVWYHVGSKDEPEGKTGFAHLFEHLMFRGSENFDAGFFETMNEIGATSVNGTTSVDRTNYFQTVPTPALERILWIESDRMGHLLGAVTQEALDAERGIVQNERRQRYGGPYGMLNVHLYQGLLPADHPYYHPTIGSMEDLDAASLEDVHGWFKKYYGAANTVVALSGDIDVETARTLMERYFGDIPAGPPLSRSTSWIPDRKIDTYEVMHDRVAQTVIDIAWAVPGRTTREKTLLDIAASVLAGDKTSRLYRALVETGLATQVDAGLHAYELMSLFNITVFVKEGVNPKIAEGALQRTLSAFVAEGPTDDEVQRVKTRLEGNLIRGLEAVHTKGQILAQGLLYADDPGFIETDTAWTLEATPEALQQVASNWLTTGSHQVLVLPFGGHAITEASLDRSQMPPVENTLELDLPDVQETVLSNGIKVVLAERPGTPILEMGLVFENAGTSADTASKRNLSSSGMFSLMNEGPAGFSATEFADRKIELNANIGFFAGGHFGFSTLSALTKNLEESLGLWAGTLLKPAFRQGDIERWRAQTLQGIETAKKTPAAIAAQVLTYATYGEDHPYAPDWNQEAGVEALTIDDLKAFHATWIRPDAATLYVVGDTTLPVITAQLERVFGDWKAPKTTLPVVSSLGETPVPTTPRLILVDQPGAPQTTIFAGRLIPSSKDKDRELFNAANNILGGGMTARIGSNLRVEKGWSYGAGSSAGDALAQRLWAVSAPVQGDKTAEAVVEILHEIEALAGDEPATEDELSLYVRSNTLSLPGAFESGNAVLNAMIANASYGRPYDWDEGTKTRLEGLQLHEVNQIAREYFKPGTLTWVLVGDLSLFEDKLRALNLGEIEVWNTDGERIR